MIPIIPVRSIPIRVNYISDNSLSYLINTIQINKIIKKVCLSNNRISNNGIDIIKQIVEQNPYLYILGNIEQNEQSDNDFKLEVLMKLLNTKYV